MFVSILLLLGFSAPLQGGAVTLSTGAESLAQILDQLSPYSGTPLKIRATFKDEIGYLDVKEMPIDEVKTRLATVFHATWEAKSDGEYLTRDATIANAERKEELARYGTAFRKAFVDQTRSVPSYKWTDANAIGQLRDLAAANSRTRQQYCLPVGQLFLKLISSMDFTELASNPVQETFVYATAPNRNQKALPSSAGKLLDEFLDEHASLVSALESNPKESRLAGLAHVFEGNYTAPPNLPAKIVMRVMQTDRARIHFKMSIYDRDGYRISWMQMPFLVDPAPLAADSLPAMDRWGSKPLPDSDVAQAARLALGNTASILPGADRPDLHDPLGIALNDALKAVGSEANLQVVGRLPDAAAACTIYRDPDETLSGFWREFMASTRADIDGKVLMLQPRYSQMAYEDRIRRQPLAQLFQTIGNGLPSLANLFTYVSNQRPGPSSLVELMAFGDYGIGLNNMQGMSILPRSKDSRAMIRLVGSMSRAQVEAMANGTLAFPDLTAAQRTDWATFVYRLSDAVTVPDMPTQELRGERLAITEPTERFPDGLPADLQLTDTVSEMSAVLVSRSAICRSIIPTIFVSDAILASPDPKLQPNTPFLPDAAETPCTPARIVAYNIALGNGRMTAATILLHDFQLVGSQVSSWKKLPPDQVAEITDRLTRQ